MKRWGGVERKMRWTTGEKAFCEILHFWKVFIGQFFYF